MKSNMPSFRSINLKHCCADCESGYYGDGYFECLEDKENTHWDNDSHKEYECVCRKWKPI